MIGRMSRYLVARGHAVDILTTSARSWRDLVDPSVRCIELGADFRSLFYPALSGRTWRRCRLPAPEVIVTFDLPTSWCGCMLAFRQDPPARLVAGIFNPYVFDTTRGAQVRMHGWEIYLHNYLKNIHPDSRLACETAIAEELTRVHGPGQTAQVWPVPVDDRPFRGITRAPVAGRIVSVGRLAPMKEYNLLMPGIVRRLRDRGHDAQWFVHGSGVYEAAVRDEAARHEVTPYVHLMGEIPNHRLPEVFQTAQVFVGMGTAILEASFCRVPNVLALAYDRTGATYGPIHRMPVGAIGGHCLSEAPRLQIGDEIERIFHMGSREYDEESGAVADYAAAYGLEARMRQFEAIVKSARRPTRRPLLYQCNFLYAAARVAGVHLDRHLGFINRRVGPQHALTG